MRTPLSRLPARLVFIVGGVFLLLLVLHFASIALLRHVVERELHPALPKGTRIGEVHLNLFSGLLEVKDFELRSRGELRMRFATLLLDISPWRLLAGEVHVEQARVANGYLRVERQEDGTFDLGLPPPADAAPAAADRESVPLSLAGADLDRVTVDYRDGDMDALFYIDSIKVGAYSTRSGVQQLPLEWRLQWDGRAITGDATVTLDADQLAVSGRLETGLLDLARAQRLARIEPVIEGELTLQGDFGWQPPRLSSSGTLGAPWLAYAIAGRQAQLKGLQAPDFALELITAPSPVVMLSLRSGTRLDEVETRVGEQLIVTSGLEVTGILRYADADQLELRDLAAHAARFGWQLGGREVSASDVVFGGQVVQRLDGEDPFPALHADLSAATLEYRHSDAATLAELKVLTLDDISLAPSDADGIRRLAGELGLGDGRLTQADTRVDWTSLTATLSGALSDTAPRLSAELAVSGVEVATPAFPGGPLQIAKIDAQGLELGAEASVRRLRVERIRLPGERSETALQAESVDLSEGHYAATSGVGIGEIAIDGLQTGVIRGSTGAWSHVMSRNAPVAGETTQDAATEAGAGVAWQIGGARVTGDSQFTIVDALNTGTAPVRYLVDRIEVGALSSTAPDADTPFDIALRPDRYSEFVIAGRVRPLADSLYLDAEGHLYGFGLTSVNGLVANDLGHRFLDGQFNDDFRIRIAEDQLDMHNALGIAGVEVEALPDKEGPPLATAIALLEDRHGNIRLDVRLSGNLADPDFRVLGALNRIIMKAVAGTAALAIQPLGSVLLVGGLLADQALKVTFEPALFDPASTELNPAAQKYLGQLAAKLAEKPKLAVRLCGVVVDAERQRDKKGEYLDQEADLLAIAQQRADAVRAYMVDNGAGGKQLRACRPSLDPDAAAEPRVDIRF